MDKKWLVRFVGVVCLSFLLASFLRMVDIGSTLAALQCSDSTNQFVGTSPKNVNVIGVAANISTVTPPALCGSDHSGSATWVMLANSGGDACSLAQVGYMQLPQYSTLKVFYEFGTNCVDMLPPIAVFDAPAGNHKYRVHYNRRPKANRRKIHMWFDNIRVAKTYWDPEVKWGGRPWQEAWAGETWDYGDDVPGTVSIPVYFSNMQHRPCKGCAWVPPTELSVFSTSNRYAAAWDTATIFHLWTK